MAPIPIKLTDYILEEVIPMVKISTDGGAERSIVRFGIASSLRTGLKAMLPAYESREEMVQSIQAVISAYGVKKLRNYKATGWRAMDRNGEEFLIEMYNCGH